MRADQPTLSLADLDVPHPRRSLEIRTHGLWADHVCEDPYEQWTVANEAYGVLLDDPDDALGRGHGEPTPIALDLEWYATSAATAFELTPEVDGYAQAGEVHGVIELREGTVLLDRVPSRRSHTWGPGLPFGRHDPAVGGLRAPIRLPTGPLRQVLDGHGRWLRGW